MPGYPGLESQNETNPERVAQRVRGNLPVRAAVANPSIVPKLVKFELEPCGTLAGFAGGRSI